MILKALMVILNFVIFHPPLPLIKQTEVTGKSYCYITRYVVGLILMSGQTTQGGGSALGVPVRFIADFVKDVS